MRRSISAFSRHDVPPGDGVMLKIAPMPVSILASPIASRERVLGVIEVLNKHSGHPFSSGDQVLLQLLCRFAGEILDRLSAEEGRAPQASQGAAPEVQKPDS